MVCFLPGSHSDKDQFAALFGISPFLLGMLNCIKKASAYLYM